MSNIKPQTEKVKQMFDDIAPTYDRLNHILSLSIDKIWRRRVVRAVRRLGAKEIVDIATGTGDLAIDNLWHRPLPSNARRSRAEGGKGSTI